MSFNLIKVENIVAEMEQNSFNANEKLVPNIQYLLDNVEDWTVFLSDMKPKFKNAFLGARKAHLKIHPEYVMKKANSIAESYVIMIFMSLYH